MLLFRLYNFIIIIIILMYPRVWPMSMIFNMDASRGYFGQGVVGLKRVFGGKLKEVIEKV